MTPSQLRFYRQQIDNAKVRIQRWEDAVARFETGTLPHRYACDELEKAKDYLQELKENSK